LSNRVGGEIGFKASVDHGLPGNQAKVMLTVLIVHSRSRGRDDCGIHQRC
jgi:hypothetical protein